ncbi:phosphosulfolactate synthase [Brevibacillus fluminis]|uniref:phosphosulfolactate synthase n=1 Tax=Brevibacillus fluminis TaxID=511487 RepID=UPI003F8A0D58
MKGNETPFWPASWLDPSGIRADKPRTTGITMVIDKGLGLRAAHDCIQTASPYMDVYKIGFGTSVLYPFEQLQQKVELAKANQLHVMPGGTFFEICCAQAPLESYLARMKAIGFNALEISDGTLPLTKDQRHRAISFAAEAGFTVYSEFGKKTSDYKADINQLLETLEADLYAGASYVIVEARESGNVGVFSESGEMDTDFLHQVTGLAGEQAKRLIWEAPQKHQQVAMLQELGLDVNLGNIAPAEILSLEALRRGLRGDTTVCVLTGRR